MSGSSDERALATSLAAMSDAELAALFAARSVPSSASARDFFDLADWLLSDPALDRALAETPAPLLTALCEDRIADADTRAALHAHALVDDEGHPYRAVRERIATRGLALTAQSEDVPPTLPAPALAVAAAAERAFASVSALTDILLAALANPLARTAAGPVIVAERRLLVDDGAVADAGELEDLLTLGIAAGLLHDVGRAWSATAGAQVWIARGTAERWDEVARAFVRALPAGIRTPDGGFVSPAGWSAAYPLDAGWRARADALIRTGIRWGIFADDSTEPPWTTPLRSAGTPDLDALRVHLPAEIDRVYLQADLTAIAPGPLRPALEQRLRTMTVRETRAQASTYRFSAQSLAGAVSGGETAASLRSFLGELSLSGIPQPLDYLIESTAARHGLIQVAEDPETGRAIVRSDDAQALLTIAVDQALRPLGLVEEGGRLRSRVSRDTVYWALADARYPVVAVDAAGRPQRVTSRVTPVAAPPPPAERYATLIATLRGSHDENADAAWLERELEQAVRSHALLEVIVRLPDGATRVLTMEATGLGGGRLRGRDRAADVERTLPLSSIESARPL